MGRSMTVSQLIVILPSLVGNALAFSRRDDDDDMPGLHGNEYLRTETHIAHGVLISIPVVLIIPLSGMIIRLAPSERSAWMHAAWQLASLGLLIVGFAMGVWLNWLHNEIWNKEHEIFGMVIVGLFLIQPILRLLHVRWNRAHGKKNHSNMVQIWFGRILMILGIINGGRGINFADTPRQAIKLRMALLLV